MFTIGLGSNVLVADEGVDALVLRLEGELAAAETRRQPSRRRRWRGERCLPASHACGRTRRVRVRLRDSRNGRRRRADERGRLRRRLARDSRARPRRLGRGLGVAYSRRAGARVPPLGSQTGRGRRAGGVPARPEAARRDQGDSRRPPGAAQGRPADEQAHLRQRLQEPGARAVRGTHARGGAASRGIGSAARRSLPATATSSRTRATRGRRTRSR